MTRVSQLAPSTDPADARAAAATPRLLVRGSPAGPASLADHLARHGPLPWPGGDRVLREHLLAQVGRSGLTGRGGAAFPAARKVSAVLAASRAGRTAVVVGNGTEGEPASAKDKVLLAQAPHLVLDGAVTAAGLAGAARAIIVAHPAVAGIVSDAIAERRRAGLDRARLRVVTAAGSFVAGEASAVVHWIARGVPRPLASPPRVSECGLGGQPTLVLNVETLAHVALIARHGADWFRERGTPAEPGTTLVTVLGAVRAPGVFEIGVGTPVRAVLGAAGGPSRPLTALLLGGYFGSWVRAGPAMDLPFSREGLRTARAGPGAGLVAALPAGACGLAETARVARYLAGESAGQCGPCVFGLDAIAGDLGRLADGGRTDLARLASRLSQVDGRGGCAHPSGTVAMIRSALDVFRDEIDEHARGWCTGARRTSVLPLPGWQDA